MALPSFSFTVVSNTLIALDFKAIEFGLLLSKILRYEYSSFGLPGANVP